MIQSPKLEVQKDNIEVQQNFKKFNQKILYVVKKMEGSCINQEMGSCEYIFSAGSEASSIKNKFNFFIKSFLKNSLLIVEIEMSLKQCWEQIANFGLRKILRSINIYNMANEFTYELNQNKKSIIVKIFNPISFVANQFQSLFDRAIKKTFQFIDPIINPSQNKLKQLNKKLEQFTDVLQILRKTQEQSSKLPNIRKLSFSNIQQVPLKNQSSYELIKFQKLVQTYKKHLSNKFKKQARILRCIKQVSLERDMQWDNQGGSNSLVQKIHLTYKISQQSSMNSGANEQIDKALQASSVSQGEKTANKSNEEQILKTSWLVKKKPNQNGSNAFEIEKKVLTFLRGQRCYSLNSYYTYQVSSGEKMQVLYSDYYKDKFDKVLSNARYYFKAFQSLCEGLVFLRWNALSHRDLKPANILLSKNSIAKIIDFGSSCHNKLYKCDLHRRPTQQKQVRNLQLQTTQEYNLTYKTLQPSVKANFTYFQFNNHPFFDVYAFGILLQEFISNQLAKFQVGQCIWQSLHYLSQLCVEQNPSDRPDPINFYVFLEYIIKIVEMRQ